MNKNKKLILFNTVARWGDKSQVDMFFEETAELQKELIKKRRGQSNRRQICEEIADVQIMLDQLKIIYDPLDTDVDDFINKKFDRLEKMVNEDE